MKHLFGVACIAMLVILLGCGNGAGSRYQLLDRTADATEKQYATADTVTKEADPVEIKQNGFNTEDYDNIVENQFLTVKQQPLSTFSIDVDEAAYSNIRRYINNGALPPKGAVRIEEMLNYFNYNYAQPASDDPFAVYTEIAACPWNTKHRLVHIGLQGKSIDKDNLPPANLVFLIDVSGSMEEPNKLPLVQTSLKMLTNQLRAKDHVSIVTYAGNAGLVLPSTHGNEKEKIKNAIDNLEAGGSTAGGDGIKLAYKVAKEHFNKEGNNRVVLATDGDFNVGVSSDDELVTLIEGERQSGVFLTVLGFGMGNYKDNKMQQLADKGNGNHAYIDDEAEAQKVMVKEFGSTLFTIAKDVKLQVEFNPAVAKAYRLIGYENRVMANEDFNNDKKDAGELGAGHTVTALYEIIPAGETGDTMIHKVDDLKYQTAQIPVSNSTEIMTIKLRYKQPHGDISKLIIHPVTDENIAVVNTSNNFRFSAAVAEFGLLLRESAYRQNASYQQVDELARSAKGDDEDGYRSEFIQLVNKASGLSRQKEITAR